MQKIFARECRGQTVSCYPDDVEHLIKVMRMKENDELMVNVDGKWFLGAISSLNPFRITIKSGLNWETKLPCKITLYMAEIRPKQFEMVVQRGTEMGINTLVPVQFTRCNPQNLRTDRLLTIAKTAANQCGIDHIPIVHETIDFKTLCQELEKFTLVIVPYENMTQENKWTLIRQKITSGGEIAIIIGPEGGFSSPEIQMLSELPNVQLTGLTKTILRSETAALYTIANVVNLILEGKYA